MAFNIGINVVETDGSAAPAIAGAPTSVAGLLLRSRRGPTNRAVRVSSFRQFVARFGAHDARFTGAYCVEGFFQNGGQETHVARVIGSGDAAASVTLKSRVRTNTLKVSAGYRGVTEPGEWGNALYVDVADHPEFSTPLAATLVGNQPARLQGEALDPAVNLTPAKPGDPDRTLTLEVDAPDNRFVVTFNEKTLPAPAQASAQDIATAVNKVAGSRVVAGVANGGILIVSRAKGASSRVTVVSSIDDETRKTLGFRGSSHMEANGADSTNPSYTKVQVESYSGFKVGDWVRLEDGLSRDWRQVTKLEEHPVDDGTFEYFVHWTEPLAVERNEYRTEDQATLATCEFDLVVSQQNPADPVPQPVEPWEKLSLDAKRPNYAPLRVNDPFAGSSYIVLEDLRPNTDIFNGREVLEVAKDVRLGIPTPETTSLTRISGNDGDDPSTGEYIAAFKRFDNAAIQLLAVVENMSAGVLRALSGEAINYCAGASKGDCMFVGHTPQDRDAAGARDYGQNLRAAKVYGALYWPWITVIDPIGDGPNPTRVIPPTGHVLGVYARIDQTRGVWKAPAGNEAVLRGALAVERDITDRDHTDLVRNGSVNAVRRLAGTGIAIDASRTLSTDPRWRYVNVRLLFNFVKASLRDGLRWVKQEPSRDSLWNMIKFNSVTPFLLRLHQSGAFGPGAPADVFTVIVGPENNPPEEIALGNLRIEVYFYPSRPAETIILTIGQQESRATASES